MTEFNIGDRVVIARGNFDEEDRQGCWHVGSMGVVNRVVRKSKGNRSGYCPSEEDNEDHAEAAGSHTTTLNVRWDGVDYGPNPTNSHTCCSHIVDLYSDEPDAEELAEVLRSIGTAVHIERTPND